MAAYQMTLPSLRAASISAGGTAVGSGACARAGDAHMVAVAAAAADALTTSRRVNGPFFMASSRRAALHAEDLAVARLDLLTHLLDAGRVFLHQLDVGKLAH